MISKFIKKNKNSFLNFLVIVSIFSLINTISKGLVNGCDFQWQPAVLFWEGINHYQKFIMNGKGDFLCQNGEYAHLLHVLYYPFTLFKWETARILWLGVNIIFIFLIPILICKFLKLSKYKTILLLLIFITCYPSRMTLNYGQQSLFVMFFMMLPFLFYNKFSAIFSGLSYVKYSTGYIVFLNFLASKQYKYFILASIPYFAGWLIYFSVTSSDPLINFFEPVQLSLKKGYIRDADIFSLINIYFAPAKEVYFKLLILVLIFIVNFILLIKINKNNDIFFKMSLVFICPLIFFPHSNYDYVLLFPILCYSFLNTEYIINKINIFFVLYLFYFNRIINHLIDLDPLYQPILLLFLIGLVITNIYSYKNKDNLYFFNLKFY
ncbi:DUF2029 domain-containing protein [Candidatus Pelagibacter sp.]|nr:DUF2029 domain-containing protein [Candidatus Pelagibacter sp.]